MNLKAQRILELDKIKSIIESYCICKETLELVMSIMPSANIDIVNKLLNETQCAFTYLLKRGTLPISSIKKVDEFLKISELGGIIYNKELLNIKDVLFASRRIKNHMQQTGKLDDSKDIVTQTISELYSNERLEKEIGRIIISEDEIADDASSELKSIRRKIRNEQENIKDKMNSFIKNPEFSKYLQDEVITMRKDRYVVPVKSEYKSNIKGLVHDTSSSGQTFFIEPMVVLESNSKINTLKKDEAKEIERILRDLSSKIAECANDIRITTKNIIRLDFMFSKAKYALDINGIRPKVNKHGYVSIIKGRHPLIKKSDVVPIDLVLGKNYKIIVITGPNTGGKTVSLKTLGLFTLMTQAGIFVPAHEGTEISIFKEVFADIGDEQSIEQSLSTFSSHMNNIVHILKNARSSHLVLFDELGAGTDPVEGAALAIAILENLRYRRVTCAATTHYSELKTYALNKKGVINASLEFDIETLKPTYKLLIGIPGKSNAFSISQRLGLSEKIINKAKRHISENDKDFEKTIEKLQNFKSEAEKDKQKAFRYKEELETSKLKFERTKEKYQKRKEELLKDARREAYDILEEAKAEADRLIKHAQNIENVNKGVELKQKANKLMNQHRNEIYKLEFDSRKSDSIKNVIELSLGDYVVIKDSNTRGVIITEPDAKNEVTVQAGLMKIKIKISNLVFIDEQNEVIKKNPVILGAGIQKAYDVKTEIDVRGKNISEASMEIDKYLDDCHLANLKQVMIIHGKGTGALRSGIQEFLRHHHHVSSYRLGEFGEGESGVTVVTLK